MSEGEEEEKEEKEKQMRQAKIKRRIGLEASGSRNFMEWWPPLLHFVEKGV